MSSPPTTSTQMYAISSETLAVLLDKDKKIAGETQLQRYERMGASEPILDIIRRGGGPAMGAQCERVLRENWTSLLPRESKKVSGTVNTGYDQRSQCCISDVWKKLEQKSSGLWSDRDNDYHWQHIELDHPWDGLLLVGIGIHGIRVWGMTRANFEVCVKDGRATNQGNKDKNSSEGIWMTYHDVCDCLFPILDESDLQSFVSCI